MGHGITQIFSSPYYPRGNGVVERFMRTIRAALAICLDQYSTTNWDIFCPSVALAHNTTPHSATAQTPMLLATGREANIFKFRDEAIKSPTQKKRIKRVLSVRKKVCEIMRKTRATH